MTLRQRHHRKRDRNHLAFVAQLPCLITGTTGVHVAHVRYGDPKYGKRSTGMSEKPDDRWTVPLAPDVHLYDQHKAGERAWWVKQGLDPLEIAIALYDVSGDVEKGQEIVIRYCLEGRENRCQSLT